MFITFRCLATCITHLCLGLLCLRCPAPACSVYLACPTCSACSTCPAVSGPTPFCLDAHSQACSSFSVWPLACLHVWDLASCLFCCLACLPVCLLACMLACLTVRLCFPACIVYLPCLPCLFSYPASYLLVSLLPSYMLNNVFCAQEAQELRPPSHQEPTFFYLLCNHSIL